MLDPWDIEDPEPGTYAAAWQTWEADVKDCFGVTGTAAAAVILPARAAYLTQLAPIWAEEQPWSLAGIRSGYTTPPDLEPI